ncbi:MAG: AAA family ATPase, partial [Muribaculaceae bacterium]|nr:AAA family ATPase [Muribaculaceae bacterium]
MSNYSKFQKKDPPSGPLSIGGTLVTYDLLSPSQKELAKTVDKWLGEKKKTRKPILRIGAGSGFGKSVCIKYLVDHYGWDLSECYVVSYTGQSVNVLKTYGVRSSTIHATFMTPQDVPVLDRESGKPIIRRGVPLMDVKFKPVKSIPSTVKLIIIDEASFLPKSLEDILLRYNTPI